MYKVGDRIWIKDMKEFGIIQEIKGDDYHSDLKNGIDFSHFDNIHQTADDMFKELGFSKSPNSSELYIVVMDYVEFDLESKTYLTSIENITPQLHQVIHQKLIELGWIE